MDKKIIEKYQSLLNYKMVHFEVTEKKFQLLRCWKLKRVK